MKLRLMRESYIHLYFFVGYLHQVLDQLLKVFNNLASQEFYDHDDVQLFFLVSLQSSVAMTI